MTENIEVVAKNVIRPDISKMVKSGGSYHKDDFVGNALAGLNLGQVKEIATHIGLNVDKYAHLNNGQQRMTLGNQIRKLTAGEGGDENLAKVETLAEKFKEANASAAAEAAAAKEAIKAEKAAAAAAKKAAKKPVAATE